MKNYRLLFLSLACLAAVLALSACGQKSEPIKGEDRDAVLAYADPVADNIFKALDDHDYSAYIRDFNTTMQNGVSQEAFDQLMDNNISKFGKYVSRDVSSVEKVDGYIVVIYLAKFENNAAVNVRLVFEDSDAHQLAGLWFK